MQCKDSRGRGHGEGCHRQGFLFLSFALFICFVVLVIIVVVVVVVVVVVFLVAVVVVVVVVVVGVAVVVDGFALRLLFMVSCWMAVCYQHEPVTFF